MLNVEVKTDNIFRHSTFLVQYPAVFFTAIVGWVVFLNEQ